MFRRVRLRQIVAKGKATEEIQSVYKGEESTNLVDLCSTGIRRLCKSGTKHWRVGRD